MGLTSKLLIVAALAGGYYASDVLHECPTADEAKIEKLIEKLEPKKKIDSDQPQFSFRRFKYHGNGLMEEIGNYGNDIKPDWVSEYIDKPIIKYLK